jgi:hypothetical protein
VFDYAMGFPSDKFVDKIPVEGMTVLFQKRVFIVLQEFPFPLSVAWGFL